jgi:hypothetical protein
VGKAVQKSFWWGLKKNCPAKNSRASPLTIRNQVVYKEALYKAFMFELWRKANAKKVAHDSRFDEIPRFVGEV